MGSLNIGSMLSGLPRPFLLPDDVLSQCDALIVMGITHKKDRTTVKEWMEAKDIEERVADCFKELGSLKPGEAWYWSPGEDRFEKFVFRQRRTLHPREMQKLGLKSSEIQLADMAVFVERAKRELTKVLVQMPKSPKRAAFTPVNPVKDELVDRMIDGSEKLNARIAELEAKVQDLHQKLSVERTAAQGAERRLAAVREALRPQYDSLRNLFENLGSTSTSSSVDRSRYEKILTRAKSGIRTMVDYLLENGEATRAQLATIAGVSSRSAYDYITWITKNGIGRPEGKTKIVLCPL